MEMGDLVYEPPRDGPTLWEIGIPDRSAEEFYIPAPNPKYINKLYVNHPDRLAMLFLLGIEFLSNLNLNLRELEGSYRYHNGFRFDIPNSS